MHNAKSNSKGVSIVEGDANISEMRRNRGPNRGRERCRTLACRPVQRAFKS